jgi:Mannosyl-glycoprotein endo-beta-N-acetylglucosaminidase
MQRLFGASLTIALLVAVIIPAAAADLPEVKVSDTNQVPACATPGRLMAYLHERNPRMSERFDSVATEYMRQGEELGIRWDIAFFQMILETGALSYTGDVRADQNNFAGLGASGGGKHGERFADISSGVKAHLQHLLMYAGDHIDNPVAERTRKVQEWGVLTDWQRTIKGPMTFTLVAKQWAPTSRGYVRDITAITDGFYNGECNAPDPRPELVQEARKGRELKPQTEVAELAPENDVDTSATSASAATAPTGTEIAERAIEQARKEDPKRTGLGAGGMLGSVAQGAAKAAAGPPAIAPEKQQAAVTLINPSKSQAIEPAATAALPEPPAAKPDTSKTAAKADAAEVKTETAKTTATANAAAMPGADTGKGNAAKGAEIQTASVAGAATQLKVPAASTPAKCKVWTASYGGQRAILIKATTGGTVNYTVLDVNEANEKREVDAYIAAYAKGGQRVAAFPNQTQALDQAFTLCPEG